LIIAGDIDNGAMAQSQSNQPNSDMLTLSVLMESVTPLSKIIQPLSQLFNHFGLNPDSHYQTLKKVALLIY
jgi:hypothetical protein